MASLVFREYFKKIKKESYSINSLKDLEDKPIRASYNKKKGKRFLTLLTFSDAK